MTPGGVVATKYSPRPDWEVRFRQRLSRRWFPRASHIVITRNDKIRQVVSWWRAIQSDHWHQPVSAQAQARFSAPHQNAGVLTQSPRYDTAALDHLLDGLLWREARIEEYLTLFDAVPLRINYEDLADDFVSTLASALEFLRLPSCVAERLPRPPLDRMSDGVSDSWVRRYRRERRSLG